MFPGRWLVNRMLTVPQMSGLKNREGVPARMARSVLHEIETTDQLCRHCREPILPSSSEANRIGAPADHVELFQPCFAVRDFRALLLFALAYFASVGYGSLFGQANAAPLWFPDSVLLCVLLLTPLRKWWLYLLAALLIRLIPALHPPVPDWFLFATCINDLLKALFAAYLLRRLSADSTRLSSLRTFVVYVGVAVLLVPALSAFGGAAARQALGHAFWPAWNQWFLGDAIANLVLTPALL
jgi:hypothetical protein